MCRKHICAPRSSVAPTGFAIMSYNLPSDQDHLVRSFDGLPGPDTRRSTMYTPSDNYGYLPQRGMYQDDGGRQAPQARVVGPPQPSFLPSPVPEPHPLPPPTLPSIHRRSSPPAGPAMTSMALGLDQRFVDAILALFGLGADSEKVIMTMIRAGSKSTPLLEQADLATRVIQLAATLQVREMLVSKDMTAPSSGIQAQLDTIAGAMQDQEWRASEGLVQLIGYISRKEVYMLKRITWNTLAADILTALKLHPKRAEYDIDAILNDPVRAPKLNSVIKKAARVARDGLGRDFRDSLGSSTTQRARFKPLRDFVHHCNVKYRQLGRSDSIDNNYLYRDAIIRRYIFDAASDSSSAGKESECFWDQVSKHLASMTDKYGLVFTDPRWKSIIEEHLDVEDHQFDAGYIKSRLSLPGTMEDNQDTEMDSMSDPTAFLG
ncbi:hypothetical protein CYLTODRAFT_441455 [Cylindrobasidium torrendii FP15055 ss-10]|uniref:Uncharacterized protein n=1 Tax=Cylindrobasidium torrendii FP15055 ss-10 TaxID=1314674 RepID=A0A0D7BL03_9AGAR|nr:hypothetical protein CYLTODRAFT_441455 [Cylindrobasidium torrendii FP15055 ss-10]